MLLLLSLAVFARVGMASFYDDPLGVLDIAPSDFETTVPR